MQQETLILPDAADGSEENNPEYNAFVEKFKPKKTTDDCYTPELVYNAVADWVANEYGVDRARFVRPFWPGADFSAREYASSEIVVDNPPFSLLSFIIREFTRRNIPFFLFAPALTLFTAPECRPCYLSVGAKITYKNGAEVSTSFVTSLEPNTAVRTAPDLYCAVDAANTANLAAKKAPPRPKYVFPDQVVTAAMAQRWCRRGVPFRAGYEEATYINALDAQREAGKAIFGGGFLLAERAAAERAAAERAAAERAAAERAAAERAAAERAAAERAAATQWELSDRERAICGLPPRETEQQRLF